MSRKRNPRGRRRRRLPDGQHLARERRETNVHHPGEHAVFGYDLEDGALGTRSTVGVAAAAPDGERVAVAEGPVVYHDEGERRGADALRAGGLSSLRGDDEP